MNCCFLSMHASSSVPQVLKDMAPMMWVSLDEREQDGSINWRKLTSIPGMEAFSRIITILFGEHCTVALPVSQSHHDVMPCGHSLLLIISRFWLRHCTYSLHSLSLWISKSSVLPSYLFTFCFHVCVFIPWPPFCLHFGFRLSLCLFERIFVMTPAMMTEC